MATPRTAPIRRPTASRSMQDVASPKRFKPSAPRAKKIQANATTAPRISDISTPEAPSIQEPEAPLVGGMNQSQRDLAHQQRVIQSHLQASLERQHLRSLSEARAVQSSVSSVPAPSAGRYMIGKIFAVILDFVDILTTIGAFVGIGWVAGVIIDSFFGLILMKWVSQGYATKGAQAQANIGQKLQGLDRRITSYRNTATKLARAGRKIAHLRKPGRKRRRSIQGRRSFNPFRRMLVAIGLDSIPFVEFLPMKYLLVRSLYKDHVQTYNESQAQSESFISAQKEEANQFAAQQQQQAEELYTSYKQTLSA